MTAKIDRFLAEQRPPTPCLVLDLDRVAENYASLRAAFPAALIYYAMKANPARPILQRLSALGSHFDAASWEEIALCLEAGIGAERISFGNTIKKAGAITQARAAGVDLFVFDSEEELAKIARHAPRARVFCRLEVGSAGSSLPLARKFGTGADMAGVLMLRAREMGLEPYGLSFHVGSQQERPESHEAGIGLVAMVAAELAQYGVRLGMINLGGGFPAHYGHDIPAIGVFAAGIDRALRFHFGTEVPAVFIEPGRCMVADAGVVSAEVVLVSQRSGPGVPRWVYLDIGKFAGLAETEGEAVRYPFRTPHDGTPEAPAVVAGPTCDSADILYEKAPVLLPLALREGDRVELLATGAYVTTYASTGFNGFKPLQEHYI